VTVERALAALKAGSLVVLPTDTVYGVGCAPFAPGGIESLFAAKGRPRDKAIPVLGASLEDLRAVAVFDARAEALAARFWPGPLTLVLPRAPGFTHDLGGDDPATVAVRVPAHHLARALLTAAGPLAVTSANRSGEPPAATVEQARAALGNTVAVYLDGGPSAGEPSTVARLTRAGAEVLRPGAVTLADLDAALGSQRS
jgi:tRNA threonylcarbamoyl adenosine modification protein (Sua5/YciO/YrdC/YwlC family)